MPNIDWIPGLSQLKSFVQVITGDTEGAKRTAENFFKECPGVSQITSVVQLAAGDAEGALETQRICLNTINNVADGISVIGHVKSIAHHAVGDHERGNQALDAVTKSTVALEKIADAFAGIIQNIASMLDDASYHDSYVETIVITDNRQAAQKEIRERDQQIPEENILESYKDVKFTTPQLLSDLLKSINKDPNCQLTITLNESVSQLLKLSWLSLIMPKEFPYTVVVQLNSYNQGLYHSFIRHIHDWGEVIPYDFSRVFSRLSPLMAEIHLVTSANNKHDASEALNQFLEARKRLSRRIYNDVQITLVEIQMSMHRFLQDNITFHNYLGRCTNRNGLERPYYKVKSKTGTKVMVIGLSDKRFKPSRGDKRPIRQLITVFFESWEAFKSHGMLETKNEMQIRWSPRWV